MITIPPYLGSGIGVSGCGHAGDDEAFRNAPAQPHLHRHHACERLIIRPGVAEKLGICLTRIYIVVAVVTHWEILADASANHLIVLVFDENGKGSGVIIHLSPDRKCIDRPMWGIAKTFQLLLIDVLE